MTLFKAKVLMMREIIQFITGNTLIKSSFLRLRLILVDNHAPFNLDVKALLAPAFDSSL